MFPTGTSLRVNLPQSHCYLVANSMVGVIEFSTVLPVPVFYRYRTYSIGLYLYQCSTSTAVSFPVPVPVFYRYRICTQACFPICSHLWKGIPVALAGASISPRYTVILTGKRHQMLWIEDKCREKEVDFTKDVIYMYYRDLVKQCVNI